MKNKSVLVVDDSTDMLALQKMILEGDGFEVFTAQSGTAAFEVLSQIKDPALIILDQQMEDMSGLEFLDLLEQRKPETTEHVPIIILSGAEPPETNKAVGFIQKFPDVEVFLEKVHHFIASGVPASLSH